MDFSMGRSAIKGLMIGGEVLALPGLLAFSIAVFTTQQTSDVFKVGDLKLQTTQTRTFVIAPFLAGSALVLGVRLIGADLYRKR
jgi:hypothetical protein